MSVNIIWGKHAVSEICKQNKRKIYTLYCTNNLYSFARQLIDEAYIECVTKELLDKKTNRAVHQNIAVEVSSMSFISLEDCINDNKIIALDGIKDPHNLGAIIRSMAAFNFNKLILPKHSSCNITSTVGKNACGGLEFIDIIQVSNLSSALITLKKYGFWAVSVNMGENTIPQHLDKVVLIIGSEGDGLKQTTIKLCDYNLALPTNPCFPILNASVSASLSMYITNIKMGIL